MGLRDMYSAISALDADSTWLDVIGNNIANVNTVAYKASRVEFSDQFSQTLDGATGDDPAIGMGGTDPEQVGLGTRINAIQTLWTEGTLQNTGVSTDMAIVGDGFLVSKQGDQTYLTRAGDLTFDSAGNLVDANGGLIQGLTATIQYTSKDIGFDQGFGAPNPLPTGIADTAANEADLWLTSASLGFATDSASDATDINITRTMTMPASATSVINFSGNLDSFLQATDNAEGGVFNLGDGTVADPATLPLGLAGATFNAPQGDAVFDFDEPAAGEKYLQQLRNANTGLFGVATNAGNVADYKTDVETEAYLATPVGNVQTIQAAQAAGETDFVWDQQPPETPADQTTETVYGSNGNPYQITIQFYQVNDLGDGGVNNPNGPNQAVYAWYAFNTTNGAAVSTATLVGGTGILEGDVNGAAYNRGQDGASFWGDFLVFNTNGTLLSTGGAENNGAQAVPDIYIPNENVNGAVPGLNGDIAPSSPLPTQGSQVVQISLNFGQAGILGDGESNGLYSEAEGTYQIVNGVNTYVPNSTAYAASQNGFTEGQLESVQFNSAGQIEGTFSNGQTTAIAQVILAMPNNPGGLISVGDNYYQASSNSGAMFVGFAGQEGVGTVQGDTLELSNVDLTTELTNMIIAERSFDVNSRVIAVENADLQTLAQLGQGG